MPSYREIIQQLGTENGEKKRLNQVYSCSPYVYTQCLYQYLGAPNAEKEILITIDEAQGVAFEEIKLIKKLNDDKVIFNLFGDVKQHIEGKKGIDDWKCLKALMQYDSYEMSENYRNASQITEFCNNRIKGINMLAMNTAGKGVRIIKNDLFALLGEQLFTSVNGKGLAAIIVRSEEDAEKISKLFSKYKERIWNMQEGNESASKTCWNLLTIDSANGLEFTTALVCTFGMTNNEKYIAYTRALNELIIYEGDIADHLRTEMILETTSSENVPLKVETEKSEQSIMTKNVREDTIERTMADHLLKLGLEVIDKREQGGSLWVVGGEEISLLLEKSQKKYKAKWIFCPNGGKTTNYQPGWFTKSKK